MAEPFPEPRGRKSLEGARALSNHYDQLWGDRELYSARTAKGHDVQTFSRLHSVPGLGKLLALVLR